MKFLQAFFTIYLLFLAVQPCEDLVVREIDAGQRASIEQTTSQECPDSSSEHECSPFCICACRQMSAMQVNLTPPSDKAAIIARQLLPPSAFANNYFHQFPDNIWQPPKNKFTI